MKYLKVKNRPLGFALPKTHDRAVDWGKCGISVETMRSHLVQGHVKADRESDYVSLLPLGGEPNDIILQVIDETNGNSNPLDSAEIIDQAQYDTEKAAIKAAMAELKALSQA